MSFNFHTFVKQYFTNMLDLEDDRMFVIDSAIKHKLGTKEEIIKEFAIYEKTQYGADETAAGHR